MRLITERLILRPWNTSDAADLFSFTSDRTIGDACGWPIHTCIEQSERCIAAVLSKPECYAIVLKESFRPIGCISLSVPGVICLADAPGSAEIGFWIGSAYRGRGLIPEAVHAMAKHAFEDLNITALWCAGYADNHASQRVQIKTGFHFHHSEGAVPNARGEYRTVYYSKLSAEAYRRIASAE